MNLRGLLNQSVTIEFHNIEPTVFEVLTGDALLTKLPKTDAEIVAEVYSLASSADPGYHTSTFAIQAALYQDDDAHDTCSLTACLNPLHPGPCKGWKGTLHDISPGAWHTLEAARVEKANHKRIAKIEALKAANKPIPHKLLQPILPKPKPDAGQTAKKASGEAHAAGKAISDSAGVVNNHPGKVTLGQAVKNMKPAELGPKGKKPTVASKGIAHVIAQEKVTPQYKLDKAASITPEQWSALSADDKATIRGELAKVQKDGFGPQQKKATDLLAKLSDKPAGPASADAAPALPPTHAATLGHLKNGMTRDEWHAAGGDLNAIDQLLKKGLVVKGDTKTVKIHGEDVDQVTYHHAPNAPATPKTTPGKVNVAEVKVGDVVKGNLVSGEHTVAKITNPSTTLKNTHVTYEFHDADGKTFFVGNKNAKASVVTPEKPKTPTLVTPEATGSKKGVSDQNGILVPPKSAAGTSAPEVEPAKPKPLPKHVEAAIAMANGTVPGASWSKHHLAAYQPLSAEEFHALPKGTQDKIAAELTKAQSKFLDPKKVQASKDLLAKFGKGPSTPNVDKVAKPKLEDVSFSKDLHNHAVSDAEAKKVVAATAPHTKFLTAKQIAGLTDADNPDATSLHTKAANEDAQALVKKHTAIYTAPVLDQPEVKAAVDNLQEAAWKQAYAQSALSAKQKAFSKIVMKTKDGAPGLSPIEKATLQSVATDMLEHENPPTDVSTMDKLKADTKAAENELTDKLHAAVKKANAPKPDDMSAAQIADRAKELLGPDADQTKFSLSSEEIDTAYDEGIQEGADAATGFQDVLTNPVVAAKYDALESAAGKLAATKARHAKYAQHLTNHHLKALTSGFDINGNHLTEDDKKVLAKHAASIADATQLDDKVTAQTAELKAAKTAFNDAANEAKNNLIPPEPLEPVKLTDFDQATIDDAYSNAWGDHASKAVVYGLKTYQQKQEMKAHADYPALTTELGQLKFLAGKLALKHAEAHTADLNVPTDPDTGKHLPGPEFNALQTAIANQVSVQKQFDDLHKKAQTHLDTVRASVGLKKRALPKLDTAAVKASAAEKGHYKSTGYSGPNYGKSASGKQYMVTKVGPKIGVAHKSSMEKKAEKLGGTAAPVSSTSKIKNVSTGTPVKLGGGADSTITHIPDPLKKQITSDFKGMPDGKYLADPAEDIFNNLVVLTAAHGKSVPDGLSVDQVLKTIDETHSKSLGVANSGMLHKKVTDWLGTAAGKTYAETHSTPSAKKVKQLSGELDLPSGITLEPGEKVQKLAGPGPHDESLEGSAFKKASSVSAQVAQDQYMKDNGVKWSASQKSALKGYTGALYHTYNNYLRGGGTISPNFKQDIIDIQSAMLPLTQHTLLKRGSGWDALPSQFHGENASKMIGKTFQEPGFTSTTVAGESGHFGGPLQLEIEAPIGTPAAFVNGISHYKNQENEMLLAAGTKFKVLSVTKKGHQTVMRVRIVGDK